MSIDRSLKKWSHYLNKHDYSWTNYNQFGLESNLYKDLKIQRFPTYLVVNDKGEILHVSNRFENTLVYIKPET